MMGTKQRDIVPARCQGVEALVPHYHIYRHVERTLDLSFARKLV